MPQAKSRLPPDLLALTRYLREQQTDVEKLHWALLRNRGLGGFKFRRQQPVDPYVLDFYSAEMELAVELDRVQHEANDVRDHDDRRSLFLRRRGIRVIRFRNEEVLDDTQRVLRETWDALRELPKTLTFATASYKQPGPSPNGRGEP
jgi:very-short-patch-repair endonuclease